MRCIHCGRERGTSFEESEEKLRKLGKGRKQAEEAERTDVKGLNSDPMFSTFKAVRQGEYS